MIVEVKSVLKQQRSSAQKIRLVIDQIRGLKVESAIDILFYGRTKACTIVKKALDSAIANAENNHQLDIDILKVSEAYCGKGMVMKRWRARAKGRPGRIQKFLTNITIKLSEEQKDSKGKK